MTAIIHGGKVLTGSVDAPGSKAHTHRTFIASLLSDGVSKVRGALESDDTEATMRVIKALGAKVDRTVDSISIAGDGRIRTPKHPVDCGESGATLRFTIPIAALAPEDTKIHFRGSLKRRPLQPYLESLRQIGVETRLESEGVLTVKGGGIEGGRVRLRGDISSQFISGILFAAPKAERDTEITITTPLESSSYVDLTINILEKHGIKIDKTSSRNYMVRAGQRYTPFNHQIPGDFSSASYILAAGAVAGSKVKVSNLDLNSCQSDRIILEILKLAGAEVRVLNGAVEVSTGRLTAFDLDASDCPDLVPVCAALASFAEGETTIRRANRLRFKESDRLTSLRIELGKMGSKIVETEDGLTIRGPGKLHGAEVDPHNDHRIAMACAVVALGIQGQTSIMNVECINKSYPRFLEDIVSLGADVNEQ
ncbi:MAG: 3-phosphoshikimate 1-carboxyvinyltransferase [Candidatus Bathyarchaeia archaeon]